MSNHGPKPRWPRWYDSLHGIADAIKTLRGMNELHEARREAYRRHEVLQEFVILGRWWLDTCGNMSLANSNSYDVTPKEAFEKMGLEIPPVIGYKEMWEVIRATSPDSDKVSMAFAMGRPFPAAHLLCPDCHRGWTPENAHDFRFEHNYEVIDLKDWVGRTLGEYWDSLEGLTDAERYPNEIVLQNDRYIDPAPKYPGSDKDWEKNVVKNERGWVRNYELAEELGYIKPTKRDDPDGNDRYRAIMAVVRKYVIRRGDKTELMVGRYYHKACLQAKIDLDTLDSFRKAFSDAGVETTLWKPIENGYGSRSYRGMWYEVMTDFGLMRVGWRKRVIDMVFPDFVDTTVLFPKEDVTKSGSTIHAWSYEKMVEYLKVVAASVVHAS